MASTTSDERASSSSGAIDGKGAKSKLSSRRAVVDEDGNEIIAPGCFTRSVVACPCVIMWVSFAVAICLSIIGLNFTQNRPTAEAGYDTPAIPEQADWFAWGKTFSARYKTAATIALEETQGLTLPLYMLYEGLEYGDEIFTVDAIQSIATFERQLLEDAGWHSQCKPVVSTTTGVENCTSPTTVLRYLYLNDQLHESQCKKGFCDVLQMPGNVTLAARLV